MPILHTMKRPFIPKTVQYILLVFAAALLCWLAFRGQDFSKIGEELSKSNWTWIWIAVLLSLIGHIIRAMRWQLLIQANGKKSSLISTLVALMLGYLSNLGIPRLGEFTRCGSLNRLTGISVLGLGGTVVAERAVDILSLLLIVLATILFAGNQIKDFAQVNIFVPFQGFLSEHQMLLYVFLGIGFAGFVVLVLVLRYFLKNNHAILQSKLFQWLGSLWEGLLSALRIKQKGLFLFYTLLIWVLYFSGPLCALLALDMGGDQLLEISLYVFVFGSLARTIPLPGGSAGAYHLIISRLLLIYGFAEYQALGLATLNHLTQTLFQLVFGIVAAIVFVFLLRKAKWLNDAKKEDSSMQDHPIA